MYNKRFKRFFDIIFGLLFLFVFWPVFIFVALFVYISSPGPVIYKSKRVGRFGKSFIMYKFRTMVLNADVLGGASTALNDARLINGGRTLRKYKLDELPQIFNVLVGEMSFVGPRPQVEFYTSLYDERQSTILNARPGLTDLASCKYVDMDSFLNVPNPDAFYREHIEPDKNRFREAYVSNITFLGDMKILVNTFRGIFLGKIN